mmetsp:Transcript_10825/g.13543  ORF Transcript_10825/g.13543 Transcript_10825/m.13543 type:complete len:376 (-) Transcript_10825:164-1291(-)
MAMFRNLGQSLGVGKSVIRIWEFRCKPTETDSEDAEAASNANIEGEGTTEMKRIILHHNPLTKDVQVTVDNHELPPGHTKFKWSALPGYISIIPVSQNTWMSRLNGSYKYECVLNGQKLKENNDRINDESDKVSDLIVKIPEVIIAGDEVVWYKVEVDMKLWFNNECTSYKFRVHRRFRDFRYVYSRACAAFRHTHLLGSVPTPPERKVKILEDHFAPEFLERRRCDLETWLRRLLMVPRVASNPDVETFLGGMTTMREVSIVVHSGSIGVRLQQKGTQDDSGVAASVYPQAEVQEFTNDKNGNPGVAQQSGLIGIGHIVSKVEGESVVTERYDMIVYKLKTAKRPLVVHFIGYRFPVSKTSGETKGDDGDAKEE